MFKTTRNYCCVLTASTFIGLVFVASSALAQSNRIATNQLLASQDDFRTEARARIGLVTSNKGTTKFSVQSASDAWAAQMQCNALQDEVKKGDVLTLSFEARVLAEDNLEQVGQILGFISRSNPWQPIAQNATRDFFITRNWSRFKIAVKSEYSFPKNSVYAALQFGKRAQVIEIRNVELRFYGQIELSELPTKSLDYMPADNRWLAKMNSEIQRNRQSNIQIVVRNEKGQPIPDARIELEQLSHNFAFGTFVGETPIKAGPDAERFRKTTTELFNRVTVGRYWADEWGTASERGLVKADNILKWAASTGLEIKSHVLVYPKYIPKTVVSQRNSPDAFRQSIELAMKDALDRTRQIPIAVWDGTNELRDDTIIEDVLGLKYYARIFNIADSAQPNARWFLNEYGILSGHPSRQQNIEEYEQTIQEILDSGGALEGIGIQCHFEAQDLTTMPDIWQILNRLAKFNLPIEITEFDIDCNDEVGQSIYTRDFLTTVFAHPAVTGITTWGFWQGDMWRPAGAMYATDWREKPNGKIWRELIFNDWQTNTSLTTGTSGTADSLGFMGLYRVTVEFENQHYEQQFSLPAKGIKLSIQLPSR